MSNQFQYNLQKITEYAALFMSPNEIAILLDYDIKLFIQQIKLNDSDVNRAYNKGKIQTKASVRKRIIDIALKGSASAQEMVRDFIVEQSKAERDDCN